MVTPLIFALAIVAIIGIAIYFWQKSSADRSEPALPPPPDLRGLFAEDPPTRKEAKKMALAARKLEHAALVTRAQNGERSALEEAHKTGDTDLCDRVLSELVRLADSDQKLFALMSYVSKNEFQVNTALASAVVASWRKSPDRSGTSKALHFAALSDDANLYRDALEAALEFWRAGKLADVSAMELRALFDGEFWILSSRTRSSGAGFILKRTLDIARRELEAATSKARA